MSYPRWSTLSLLPERTVAGLSMNVNQQHKGYVALKWTSKLNLPLSELVMRTSLREEPLYEE